MHEGEKALMVSNLAQLLVVFFFFFPSDSAASMAVKGLTSQRLSYDVGDVSS